MRSSKPSILSASTAVLPLLLLALPASAALTTDCSDRLLTVRSGRPGTTIPLEPAEPVRLEDARAELSFDGARDEMALLESEVAGVAGLFLSIPTHPNGRLEGGRIDLILHLGERSCLSRDFRIEPLEPAPGEFRRFIETAIETVYRNAEAAGLDPRSIARESLDALDLRTLSATAIPLAIGLIHAAELRDDLIRIESALEDDPRARALIDAVVATTNWREQVPETATAISLGPGPFQPGLLEPVRIAAFEIPFPRDRPKIKTAAKLAERMRPAIATMNKLNGASGKVLNDASLIITLLSAAPGAGGIIAGAAATATFLYKTSQELEAYGNPTRFTRFDFTLYPTSFTAEDTGGAISITKVEADVVSEPWNVTLKIFDSVRAVKPGGLTLEGLKKKGLAIDTRSDAFLGWLGLAGAGSDAASNVIDRPGHAVPEALVIPAYHWRKIDMADDKFIEVDLLQAAGQRPAIAQLEHPWYKFEAINAGSSEIHLTAPRSIFGAQASKKRPASVEAIEMTASSAPENPARASAHAKVELCFTAKAEKAQDKKVEMTLTGGGRSYGPKKGLADGKQKVCFSVEPVPDAGKYKNCQEPSREIKQSFELKAISLAERGARRRDDSRVARPTRRALAIHSIDRTVEQVEEKPEDCEELAANWTWTFASGVLECKKLPFPVTLPGFSSAVQLEELENGVLMVTGASTGDQLRLESTGIKIFDGVDFQSYRGRQSLPKSMGLGGGLEANYILYVTSAELLEGHLDLEKAPYQGDICSIFWPFSMRPIPDAP